MGNVVRWVRDWGRRENPSLQYVETYNKEEGWNNIKSWATRRSNNSSSSCMCQQRFCASWGSREKPRWVDRTVAQWWGGEERTHVEDLIWYEQAGKQSMSLWMPEMLVQKRTTGNMSQWSVSILGQISLSGACRETTDKNEQQFCNVGVKSTSDLMGKDIERDLCCTADSFNTPTSTLPVKLQILYNVGHVWTLTNDIYM